MDLIEDPKAYGLPTFQEFQKDRDRWLGKKDDIMSVLDQGPTSFRKDLKRIKYRVQGLEMKGLEEVETMLGDFGYSTEEVADALYAASSGKIPSQAPKLKIKMDMIPNIAGTYDIVVDFFP